jgi:hypothetical protein
MEKQIENILIKVDEGTMPVQQALSELLRLFSVNCQREQLIAFLRQQSKLHYITIYENDFDFADKLLKAINCG